MKGVGSFCWCFEVSGVHTAALVLMLLLVLLVLALPGTFFLSAIPHPFRISIHLLASPFVANNAIFLCSPSPNLKPNQVAIGESTCGAIWFSGPLSDDCDECNSLFDISELSRIALERASTARYKQLLVGRPP